MQLTFDDVRRQVEKIADGNFFSLYYCSSKHMGKTLREYHIYCNFKNHKGKTWTSALNKLKSSIKK